MTSLSLGVGCFHFAPGKAWSGKKFDMGEFAEQLKKALEAESNINNVELKGFRCSKASTDVTSVQRVVPDIRDGPDYFPHLSDASISFDLFIPSRLQNELCDGSSRTGTENFHLSIAYDWHFPVALVEPVSDKRASRPSDAVVCVRRFLDRQLGKGRNAEVEFQCLGPSPFHANFWFEFEHEDTALFDEYECSVLPLSGYDLITLNVKTSDPVPEAKARAIARMAQELEFYYEVVQARAMNLQTWGAIEHAIDHLRTKASLPIFRRMFASFGIQEAIDNALFLTTDLERCSISVTYDAKRWKGRFGAAGGQMFPMELH